LPNYQSLAYYSFYFNDLVTAASEVREGADKSLAREGRKQAVLLGKKENKIQTYSSLLLHYEKTFDEGRKTQ